MTDGAYRSIVLHGVEDLPLAPESHLKVTGASVVRYVLAEVPHDVDLHTLFPREERDFDYLTEKLWDRKDISYSTRISGPPLTDALAERLKSKTASFDVSVIQFQGRFALVLYVLVLAAGKVPYRAIELDEPLGVDEVLGLLQDVTSVECTESLRKHAASLLGIAGSIPECHDVESRIAVEIWGLEPDCRPSTVADRASDYESSKETPYFAWELAAIKSFAVDHMKQEGLWRQMRREQVINEMRSGYSLLDDGVFLLNDSCCLEVCNLPQIPRERSLARMKNFGYDSSGILTWSLALLTKGAIQRSCLHYEASAEKLLEKQELDPAERLSLGKELLRTQAVTDALTDLARSYREPRSRAIDEEVRRLLGTDQDVARLSRNMERSAQMADDLANVWLSGVERRRNVLLALVATVISLMGLPGFVEDYRSWVADGSTNVAVGTSLALVVIAAIIVFAIWRSVLRKRPQEGRG